MDSDQYCRDLEAHLCRCNGGHLVRVVGPAFEMVQGWFRQGIPFKVACLGIDRHVERAASRGARRRPVRLEFCEADVLDAFDQWRRAVGVRSVEPEAAPAGDGVADVLPARDRGSLPSHLERVIARLTAQRAGSGVTPEWSELLDSVVRRLDALVAPARKVRGDARGAMLAELDDIDAALVSAAGERAPDAVRAAAAAEAERDMEPFKTRMAPADYSAALERARIRALRQRLDLPGISLE